MAIISFWSRPIRFDFEERPSDGPDLRLLASIAAADAQLEARRRAGGRGCGDAVTAPTHDASSCTRRKARVVLCMSSCKLQLDNELDAEGKGQKARTEIQLLEAEDVTNKSDMKTREGALGRVGST